MPCEYNSFLNNAFDDHSVNVPGAVFFGPLANYNTFIGDNGAGVVDYGTGNIVLP